MCLSVCVARRTRRSAPDTAIVVVVGVVHHRGRVNVARRVARQNAISGRLPLAHSTALFATLTRGAVAAMRRGG